MKTLVLSAAMLILTAGAYAQAPIVNNPQAAPIARHHHHNPHKAAAKMAKQLGLSADQQARVEPILADRQQKVDAVRANTQLSPVEQHQQIKAIHREARTQLGSVLTPDQLQQMKPMHHSKHSATVAPTGA